jgi:hypothetical protein
VYNFSISVSSLTVIFSEHTVGKINFVLDGRASVRSINRECCDSPDCEIHLAFCVVDTLDYFSDG